MTSGTYYHARVTAENDDPEFPTHSVTLLTASEDGYEVVTVLKGFLQAEEAEQIATAWRKQGRDILPFLLAMKRSHIVEDRMWVQTQAPAGNWVNSTGIPVWYHDPDSVKGARMQAESYAEYERKHGRNARVIRQYYEVL